MFEIFIIIWYGKILFCRTSLKSGTATAAHGYNLLSCLELFFFLPVIVRVDNAKKIQIQKQ